MEVSRLLDLEIVVQLKGSLETELREILKARALKLDYQE